MNRKTSTKNFMISKKDKKLTIVGYKKKNYKMKF